MTIHHEDSNDIDTAQTEEMKANSLVEDHFETATEKNDSSAQRWYHIDFEMLPAKLAYFFNSAKRQGTVPFMIPYFNSLGLNKSEAGAIVGFRVLGTIVGGPFWGVIADKKQAHRILFIILIVFSSLFICSQLPISLPYANQTLNTCPNVNLKEIRNQTSNSTQELMAKRFSESDRRRLFFLLFAVNILVCFFDGSTLPFIEFGVLRKIQITKDRNLQYGKQRAISPIGSAIGIVIANLIIENFPTANITCFAVIYLLYTMWGLLELASSLLFFRETVYDNSTKQQPRARKLSMQQTLRKTCLRLDIIVLLIASFFNGSLYAVFRGYTFVFLKELHADSALITITMALPFILTSLSVFFADPIIKMFRGDWNIIAFSFLVFSVRFLSMSLLQNPWYAVIIEALHPFCASLFLVSAMHQIKEITPPKILTLMCTIYYIVLQSIGNIAGSSIGGVIYEEFGGRTLYRAASCASGICFICLMAFALRQNAKSVLKKKDRHHEGLLLHKTFHKKI